MKVLSGLNLNGNQITNVETVIDGTENDIVKIGSNGEAVDSGVSINDIEPNVIESISVNSSAITPVNKNVNIDLSGYVSSSDLATVATSGDYDDLENKPDLTGFALSSDLANVATTGDYDDLQNKPDLSGFVSSSDLSTVATSGDYDDLDNKPDLSGYITSSDLADVATSGSYNDLEDKPEYATVATSGDYDDLDNKPEFASVATSGDYEDLENKPDLSEYITSSDLATVATSGDYDDLENKPDLSDYLTSEDLENVSHVFETEITDSNVSGSDANTFNIFYIQSDYPVVQVVYDNKVVHDGIEITYGVGDITVEWDSTKYTVDSNNPLHITVVG